MRFDLANEFSNVVDDSEPSFLPGLVEVVFRMRNLLIDAKRFLNLVLRVTVVVRCR